MTTLNLTAGLTRATATVPARRGGPSVAAQTARNPAPRAARLAPPRAQGKDFDAILADFAEKFEGYDTNKKIAVVGWSAAALGAVAFAEKIMHSIVFDVLLGGPVQLLGLLAIPGIALKALDGKDLVAEAGEYVSNITKRLPGLDK